MSKTRQTALLFIVLLNIFSFQLFAQNTIIKAGHFFDARSGKMLDNQIIIIQDGKIKEVGSNLKFDITDTIIDLSNSWVLPGLMDCHVYITANNPYRIKRSGVRDSYISESSSFRALRGAFVAEQFLMSGFTTIKEIGNDANYATADIIKAIKAGWIKGPTIIYAGKIIAPYGGQSRGVNIENEKIREFEYRCRYTL